MAKDEEKTMKEKLKTNKEMDEGQKAKIREYLQRMVKHR
jgi:hypothetical protein